MSTRHKYRYKYLQVPGRQCCLEFDALWGNILYSADLRSHSQSSLSHISFFYLFGFSPLCVFKSVLNLSAREDAYCIVTLHWLQLFDFSPLCIFKCLPFCNLNPNFKILSLIFILQHVSVIVVTILSMLQVTSSRATLELSQQITNEVSMLLLIYTYCPHQLIKLKGCGFRARGEIIYPPLYCVSM